MSLIDFSSIAPVRGRAFGNPRMGSRPLVPEVILHALHPRVAIMNNGAKKGGNPAAWKLIKESPGLEDLWQVHFAIAGAKESNVAEPMIANIDDNDEGKYLKVSAMTDGSFTVTNSRNKYSKTYPAK